MRLRDIITCSAQTEACNGDKNHEQCTHKDKLLKQTGDKLQTRKEFWVMCLISRLHTEVVQCPLHFSPATFNFSKLN